MLSLYEACHARKALPHEGGVMDQPADILRWFRVIDKVIEAHREKEREREKSLGGRRG